MAMCSSGLPRGRCVAQGHELRSDEYVAAFAVVRLSPDGDAELDIGASGADESSWVHHGLTFQEQDPPEERWKTIGLLVASLAGSGTEFELPRALEREGGAEKETAAGKEPAPGLASEADADRAREGAPHPSSLPEDPSDPGLETGDAGVSGSESELGPALRVNLMLAAQMGRGLIGAGEASSSWQAGPLVRVGVGTKSAPWELDVTAGWSTAPSSPERLTLTWARLDVSVAYRLVWTSANLVLRPRGLVLFERLDARAQSSTSRAFDQQARWNPGVGGGGGLAYPHDGPWALEAEGVVLHMNGGTGIEVDGNRLGFVPAWNFRTSLGVSHRF